MKWSSSTVYFIHLCASITITSSVVLENEDGNTLTASLTLTNEMGYVSYEGTLSIIPNVKAGEYTGSFTVTHTY